MIDISALGLEQPDTIEWDKYEEAGTGGKPLPPKGRYTVEAPVFTSEHFEKGKQGQLVVRLDPTICEGEHAGYELRYQRASTTKYKNRNASGLGDYLRAHGVTATPRTNEEYGALVSATSKRKYQIDADWEAYDKETGTDVKGMESFPDDGKGGKQAWIDHATAKDEQGRPKRIWARLRLTRCVPKGATK